MVGRERELEELNRELQAAIEGKGRTVLISAEAGIGKTRLVTEFLKSVKQENIIELSGWCLFNAGVPYFPFIEAFSNYYSSLDGRSSKEGSEISSLLKEPAKMGLSSKLDYLSPQTLKDQTFVAVARTIQKMAAKSPVILLIEDIHWADSASLALLHYVARAVNDSERVLVLATFRSEELTSDAAGYPHPLVETLAMMRREDLFVEISLPSLNASCVAEMAESMLGGSLQQRFAERLATESEGNALFVVESLRMLNERNGIVKENNEWRLSIDQLGVPSKFKDIMLQRLVCLNHAQRRLLDAASVIGEEFEVGLLSAMINEDSLEVTETLNVIAHSTSLVRPDESHYRFDHARSREAVYESLSLPLRQGYHKKIAETLENIKGERLLFSELAYHYAEAGNRVKAIKYSLAAGKEELAKWNNAQAIKHFQYVIQNLEEWQLQEKRAALEGLGDAYAASYMNKEAIQTFDKLADCSTGLTKLRAIRKAMDAAHFQGDNPDLLLNYSQKAEELGVSDRLEMARIIDNRGKVWGWSGRGNPRMDLADYNAALQVFEEENSLQDVAEGLCRSGTVSAFFEDSNEIGLGELLRSAAIFKEMGDIRKEAELTYWTAQGFATSGLHQEAESEYLNFLKIGEKFGMFRLMAAANWYLCDRAALEGRLEEALSFASRGLSYANKTDSAITRGQIIAQIAGIQCLLGNLEEANKMFEKMPNLHTDFFLNDLHGLLRWTGVYLAAKNCWNESDEIFQKAVKFIEKEEFELIECFTRKNYAWALQKQGRTEEAKAQLYITIKSSKTRKESADKKFGHTNLRLNVLVPKKAVVDRIFEMRFDIVNIARKSGILVAFEGLLCPHVKIAFLPFSCQINNGSIFLDQRKIGPFKVETLKFQITIAQDGIYEFEPRIVYLDDAGKQKESISRKVAIEAETVPSRAKFEEHVALKSKSKIEFESEAAEKAFNCLTAAFEEDHCVCKMQLERSGWRTLMQVMRDAKISKNDLYGRSGRGGKILSSLDQMGLIETRYFSGERGRGGRVLKVRVSRQIIGK